MLLLAIFLVYLVMASQFESLVHPFVILLTIPLAVIGAVWALWLTGTTVNVVAYIGLIMLAGIVVNQSIVLIDAVNQARERGLSKREAIVEAGRLRLRPILITKLTTILGLLPMALGIGEGAEVRAPMAITVIGGVLLTTFLTLLVIPVVYSVLDRKVYAPPAPAADARAPNRPRAEAAPCSTPSSRCNRPVTTVMMFLARARRRPDLGAAAAARELPGHHLPGHAGDHPLPRLDARGNGAAHRAPGRGSARDAVRHRGDRRRRAQPDAGARSRSQLQLGSRRRRGGVRGAHQARLDPLASCRPARTAS